MASVLPRVLFILSLDKASESVPTVHELWVTSVDSDATYENLIRFLIRKQFLVPLEPSLRYNLFFKAVAGIFDRMLMPGSSREWYGDTLIEGQTINNLIHSVAYMDGSKYPITHYECDISISASTHVPPKEKPGSPPSLDKIINDFLTSQAVNAINFTASVVTIVTALIVIYKWWSKKYSTEAANSEEYSSRPSESEIVAIRLLMTDGTQHRIEEWLTDPARLKHYIDVLNQPSGSASPLQAIFVMKNGDPIVIDVSQGAQNNIQLDELLSLLKID